MAEPQNESLYSLKFLTDLRDKITTVSDITTEYSNTIETHVQNIEKNVSAFKKYNDALELHIQMGNKASDFNLAETTQLQSLLLIKQQYLRQAILEGATYKDAADAVNKKMLAEKLATEETLRSAEKLEEAQRKLKTINEARDVEAKKQEDLKNAVSNLTNSFRLITNPLIVIAGFLAKGVLESLQDSWKSLQSITAVQLGAGIGQGGGIGDLSAYSGASLNAFRNLNYNQGESSAVIQNLMRSNALFSNRSGSNNVYGDYGYANAFTDVATATRAYGITMSESSKLMTESYRYNTGDFKGILKDLAGVSSDTKMNMAETVNYYNRLNEGISKYATQQQFATQAIGAFSDSLQKGRIAIENLNFSMIGEGLGKTVGMVAITAMTEGGREALQSSGINPNDDPVVIATKMRQLSETEEGQKHLAEITRQEMLSAIGQTGYGMQEGITLLQQGAFSGLLSSNAQALATKSSTAELEKLLMGEMISTDPRAKYKSETEQQYNERLTQMDVIAKERFTLEHPELSVIKRISDLLNNTVEDGAFKVKESDSWLMKGAKRAANISLLPGHSQLVSALTRGGMKLGGQE